MTYGTLTPGTVQGTTLQVGRNVTDVNTNTTNTSLAVTTYLYNSGQTTPVPVNGVLLAGHPRPRKGKPGILTGPSSMLIPLSLCLSLCCSPLFPSHFDFIPLPLPSLFPHTHTLTLSWSNSSLTVTKLWHGTRTFDPNPLPPMPLAS